MSGRSQKYSWSGTETPRAPVEIGPGGWARVLVRGIPILTILLLGFALLLLLRPIERLIWGLRRPVTSRLTQGVCRVTCVIAGLRRSVTGSPMSQPGAYVANHASWLDIFVLNATAPMFFVSKSEVRGWAGIGWLARGTGTLFVERKRQAAGTQAGDLAARLSAQHRLLIFPEGTSSDSIRVLPFKSSIFGAFFAEDVPDGLAVQPVTLCYHAPANQDARFFGWWGDAGFLGSAFEVLAQAPQGRVDVTWGQPIPVADHDRKSLAKEAEDAVRKAFSAKAMSAPEGR